MHLKYKMSTGNMFTAFVWDDMLDKDDLERDRLSGRYRDELDYNFLTLDGKYSGKERKAKTYIDDSNRMYVSIVNPTTKHEETIYLDNYLKMSLAEFREIDRPTSDDFIVMAQQEGIDNLIVWGKAETFNMVVPAMGIAFTNGESGLYVAQCIKPYTHGGADGLGYKINLEPYFEEEKQFVSSRSHYTSDFVSSYRDKHFSIMHKDEVCLENLKISSRVNTKEDLKREQAIGQLGWKSAYRRVGQQGMITFLLEEKTGHKYQYVPEMDSSKKKEGILGKSNQGLFKIREDKEVNKLISTYGNMSIKLNLNGQRGFMIFLADKCVKDNIWSFQEALNTISGK